MTLNASTFTVKGGACTDATQGSVSGSASTLCDLYTIDIKQGATTVYSGTATAFASAAASSIGAVTAGSSVTLTITATLSPSATIANQGHTVTQPITWTFNA